MGTGRWPSSSNPLTRGPMNSDVPFRTSVLLYNHDVYGLRQRLNQFMGCSTKEAEMMICNFAGEVVHFEYTEHWFRRDRVEYSYMIATDYGYGKGCTLKDCMYKWINIDDECDDTEFAIRSRALGASCRPTPRDHLSQLRPIQLYARGCRGYR